MSLVFNPQNRIDRFFGRWRLLCGFCPRCNSDAPHVYHCAVCKQVHIPGQTATQNNNRQSYPPTRATKALWWYTWMHPAFDSMQKEYERSGLIQS